MPGPIGFGGFKQFIQSVIPSSSGGVNTPQQAPAGPPPPPSGPPPRGSTLTDSFEGSTSGASQRNPLNAPANPTDVTFTSTGSKPSFSTGMNATSSIMLGPGGISGETTLEAEAKVEAGLLTVSVAGYTTLAAGFSRDASTTTFTVEAEVGVKGKVEGETPLASASVTGAGGVRGSYTVTLPTDAASGITTPEQAAAQLNPSLPQNLPVGATVTLTGEKFLSGGMEVTFKKVAEMFEVSAGFTEERSRGMAIAVSKLDDKTVRVTVGPTEAVSRTVEASVGLLGFEAGVSDSARVEGQLSSRQVDFDISTPAGQAAYNRFLATGELPKNDPASGTSNAASVQIVTGELTREVTFGIGLGESTLDSDEYIFTQYDDGRETFQYTGQKGPSTVVISGDPDVRSSQTYQATLTWVDSGDVEAMKQSFPGSTGTGSTVSFSFTPEEAKQVQQLAKDWMRAYREGRAGFADKPDDWVQAVATARTPEKAFLVLMTPTGNNASGDVMARVGLLATRQSDLGDGSVVLPGQYTIAP